MNTLTLLSIGLTLLSAFARAESGAAPIAADEAVLRAQKAVLQEIRAGNRDTQRLMKLMAPAIKAHNNELQNQARAEINEEIRLRNEGSKKPENAASKNTRPTHPVNSLNGASRYGGSGPDESPIMDPASVPKEVTFENGVASSQISSAFQPESAASGVDEIEFEVQPKAEAAAAKPAAKSTPRR